MTVYVDLWERNKLQEDIMLYIQKWVVEEKTPVPRPKVIKAMEQNGVNIHTIKNSIESLLSKGYIRRAYTMSNKTYYVLIKKI